MTYVSGFGRLISQMDSNLIPITRIFVWSLYGLLFMGGVLGVEKIAPRINQRYRSVVRFALILLVSFLAMLPVFFTPGLFDGPRNGPKAPPGAVRVGIGTVFVALAGIALYGLRLKTTRAYASLEIAVGL